MSEAIGTREFAEKYGVTQATVSKWCREGKIPNCNQDGIFQRMPFHQLDISEGKRSKRKGAAYGPRIVQSTILVCDFLPNHLHPINLCQNIFTPFAGGRLFAGCPPAYIDQNEPDLISLLRCSVRHRKPYL